MDKQEVTDFLQAANRLAKTIVYEDALQDDRHDDFVDVSVIDNLLQVTLNDDEMEQIAAKLPGNMADWAFYISALLEEIRRDFLDV